MTRVTAAVLALCVCASGAFAQSGFAGKWATDRPDPLQPLSDAQKRSSLSLEIRIEGNTISGTLSIGGLGGDFYTFADAKLSGSKIQFQTTKGETTANWTAELLDGNTIKLSHYLPLAGSNVLDLSAVLPNSAPPPDTPAPPASGSGDGLAASILHRVK